jgi:hypothetical protein
MDNTVTAKSIFEAEDFQPLLEHLADDVWYSRRRHPRVHLSAASFAASRPWSTTSRTLVVVGRRGMEAVACFALGSYSSAVLRSASGPVLIVPSPRKGSYR